MKLGASRIFGMALAAATGALHFASGCGTESPRPESGVRAPKGTYTVTTRINRNKSPDKLDLLFVIENSPGMADKRPMIVDAVPALVRRLVNPPCVSSLDSWDMKLERIVGPKETCPDGFVRSGRLIEDVHVGILSTSLGGHGGNLCSPADPAWSPEQDDRAHLIASVRTGLSSYQDQGFIAWDPEQKKQPAGESDLDTFMERVREHVTAVGSNGCGFSAPLEAWYRFLVDPDPPLEVIRDASNPSEAVVRGRDEALLAQRAAFLRPDSLVAIVMVNGENDCSIQDGGAGFVIAQSVNPDGSAFRMPRGTSACAADPNDPCCRACTASEQAPPPGCTPLASDPECAKGNHDVLSDSVNLRCFEQKRRFGVEFLHPIERYMAGLTSFDIQNRAGQTVRNPLFVDARLRDSSLIHLAGIVGVPWQDAASESSFSDLDRLSYLTSIELLERWPVMVGNPPTPARDALMWETPEDRTLLGAPPHPLLGTPLSPASSSERANPINGHEYSIPERDDLQYSCIYPLAAPLDCSKSDHGCDCGPVAQGSNKPVCDGTTQTHAKAYPGLRQIELLEAGQHQGWLQ